MYGITTPVAFGPFEAGASSLVGNVTSNRLRAGSFSRVPTNRGVLCLVKAGATAHVRTRCVDSSHCISRQATHVSTGRFPFRRLKAGESRLVQSVLLMADPGRRVVSGHSESYRDLTAGLSCPKRRLLLWSVLAGTHMAWRGRLALSCRGSADLFASRQASLGKSRLDRSPLLTAGSSCRNKSLQCCRFSAGKAGYDTSSHAPSFRFAAGVGTPGSVRASHGVSGRLKAVRSRANAPLPKET